MGATAAQIKQLRRMVNEPTTATYLDADITTYIEKYPLLDTNGVNPTYLNYSTTPPTVTADPDWITTYDLAAAAADIWDEKAALASTDFDFDADGGKFSSGQTYEHARKEAAKWRSRRSMRSVTLIKQPVESNLELEDSDVRN